MAAALAEAEIDGDVDVAPLHVGDDGGFVVAGHDGAVAGHPGAADGDGEQVAVGGLAGSCRLP